MAVSAFTRFNSFYAALAHKIHDLETDQLTLALCAAANAPVVGNTVLANLTQVDYTNLSTRNLTTTSSEQTDGEYKLILEDLVLTSTGGPTGPFRYVVIYNDTATNDELIGWYDYGADVTMGDGESININLDGAAGVLTLGAAA